MISEKMMLLQGKKYNEPSAFLPENLLREARRQKKIQTGEIPAVCVLDPDGDIVTYLQKHSLCKLDPYWACYHSKLYCANFDGVQFGIIGCAVGAAYAVLIAEQLFVSGCQLLISITSAGMIQPAANDSKFILITQALRDEGTSYHYLPAEQPALLNQELSEVLLKSFDSEELSVESGLSWTTDAPYRETEHAISMAKDMGVISVEMEASALYAFAGARQKNVVCYAHLTNTMAQSGNDFEKGLENGSLDSLRLILHTSQTLNVHTSFLK